MTAWLWMTFAILFEVAGTISLKMSQGLSRLIPSVLSFFFYGLCFSFLALALKKLDVGIAYAIWAAIGTALVASIGILYFGEPITTLKIVCLILIILGVAGLNI